MRTRHTGISLDKRDLVAFEKHLHATGHLVDDTAFPLLERLEIDLWLGELDTVAFGMPRLAEPFCNM